MATYDFKCLKCQKVHEHTLSMKEVQFSMKLECPSCSMVTFQRQKLRSTTPVHFIGTGWPDKDGI